MNLVTNKVATQLLSDDSLLLETTEIIVSYCKYHPYSSMRSHSTSDLDDDAISTLVKIIEKIDGNQIYYLKLESASEDKPCIYSSLLRHVRLEIDR